MARYYILYKKLKKGYIMQNYKKHNNILIQSTPNSRPYEWNIIGPGRSVRRFSIKIIKNNIIHLKRIYGSLRIPYVNPY